MSFESSSLSPSQRHSVGVEANSSLGTSVIYPSRTSESDQLQQPSSIRLVSELTPPTSPNPLPGMSVLGSAIGRAGCGAPSSDDSSPKQAKLASIVDGAVAETRPYIVECPFDVQIAKDHSGRRQLFGQGAWSKVYRGTATPRLTTSAASPRTDVGTLTPPPSSQVSQVPRVVAVKSPLSKTCWAVLDNEAVILSHLVQTPNHEQYLVPFFGYIPSLASLVLAAIPLSLSAHIAALTLSPESLSGRSTSSEPVIGSVSIWLDLARKMTAALAWLHNEAGVVHGDVKPGNILLSPNRPSSLSASNDLFPFKPLWIDFSSSRILSITNRSSRPALSALTREYTAPEMLVASVLRDPSSTATMASDVFSLAITLLVAATGNQLVYPGNKWQRQHMATEGWNVLNFIRGGGDGGEDHGNAGLRIPQGGIIEQVVQSAVGKVDQGRIEAANWRDLTAQIVL